VQQESLTSVLKEAEIEAQQVLTIGVTTEVRQLKSVDSETQVKVG
jgi:hypothetical protein